MNPTQYYNNVEQAVDFAIEYLDNHIVIGMPLGLGKPPEFINALFQKALKNPQIKLKILTALSLEKPSGNSPLEKKFMQPLLERVFGGVVDLDYMTYLRSNKLPANIEVAEFFFKPGSMLNNPHAQQHYVSSNYSHAARDVFNQGCNIAAQAISVRVNEQGEKEYSLSCNPDTGPELNELLKSSGRKYLNIGLVNENLPFMANDALVNANNFNIIIQDKKYNNKLFSTPKTAVTTPDYMIGLYASSLIKDGGTLQIGIGALGDAIVHAAKLRHTDTTQYQNILDKLDIIQNHGELINNIGGTTAFEQGLYGATEMFVDGFLHLYDANILKREVYDFWALQEVINENLITKHNFSNIFTEFEQLGLRVIRTKDFEILQYHGVFNENTHYDAGYIITPSGKRVIANMADPNTRDILMRECLGNELKNGIVLHGGFFLGPQDFYNRLHDMGQAKRDQICMTGVNKVNQLDLNPRLYKLQRRHARFINTGLMATLAGAVVSDGLADGRVVSGVGGQYNFVAMVHQLNNPIDGGRSILMIRSVREKNANEASSNIVSDYGHITIPRHLRDIVITEYGIADLLSQNDNEIIKRLLNITDSRFQQDLMNKAKKSGKLEADYQIPDQYKHNTPQNLEQKIKSFKNNFPAFPFGTDLTQDELKLGKLLKKIKHQAQNTPKWKLALDLWKFKPDAELLAKNQKYLAWLGLEKPETTEDKIVQMLLLNNL